MFYYLGRKKRLAGLYPEPVHDVVVEPFAGSAAYSLHGDRWQRRVTLVELDPDVCDVWRYLMQATRADVLGLPVMRTGDKLSDIAGLSNAEEWLIRFHINPGASQRSNVATRFNRWNESTRAAIADNLYKIRHWTLIEGDYSQAPDVEAYWFVDPPHHRSGKFYRTNLVDYGHLAEWVKARRGTVTVCEQDGAEWLPFRPLRTERTTRGVVGQEMVWTA